MKLRIRDRILSALMGLIIILMTAVVVLHAFDIALPGGQMLTDVKLHAQMGWPFWVFIGVCVALFVIGFCGIALLFRRRKDKGVVVQHTEYGDVSISMKAMENMVKKCVDAHPELNINQTKIHHSRGGVDVDIRITLMGGANIPLTVNALQKQIKQYITSCSGVDVDEIRVMVETDTAKLLPPPAQQPALTAEAAPEMPPVEKAAECLYQHQEEPATYAEVTVTESDPIEVETVEAEITEEEPAVETEIQVQETEQSDEAPETEIEQEQPDESTMTETEEEEA